MIDAAPKAGRLLGRDWSGYAGVSAFGAVLRVARLNGLAPGDIRRQLGTTVGETMPFQYWLSDAKLHARVIDLGGMPPAMATDFALATWWPFGGSIPWTCLPWHLRACPRCLAAAYHSPLFQLPGIHRCPWHAEPLTTHCVQCGRSWYLLRDWRFRTGRCRCCWHDAIDPGQLVLGNHERQRERAEALDRYRGWIESHRRIWLSAPGDFDPFAWHAAHALVVRPPALSPQTLPIQREAIVVRPTDLKCGEISNFSDPNPRVHRLPSDWQGELDALFEREVDRTVACSPTTQLPDSKAKLRVRLLQCPVVRLGESSLFDSALLHSETRRTLQALSLALEADCASPESSLPGLDAHGQRVLVAAIRQVFVRGYVEALHAALMRERGWLLDRAMHRGIHRAWVTIERVNMGHWLGTVAWTPQVAPWRAPNPPRLGPKLLKWYHGLASTLASLATTDQPSARRAVARALRMRSWGAIARAASNGIFVRGAMRESNKPRRISGRQHSVRANEA